MVFLSEYIWIIRWFWREFQFRFRFAMSCRLICYYWSRVRTTRIIECHLTSINMKEEKKLSSTIDVKLVVKRCKWRGKITVTFYARRFHMHSYNKFYWDGTVINERIVNLCSHYPCTCRLQSRTIFHAPDENSYPYSCSRRKLCLPHTFARILPTCPPSTQRSHTDFSNFPVSTGIEIVKSRQKSQRVCVCMVQTSTFM